MEQQKSVIIDAGHGGAEPGAMFEGRKEKDDTLRLAVAVGAVSYTHLTLPTIA